MPVDKQHIDKKLGEFGYKWFELGMNNLKTILMNHPQGLSTAEITAMLLARGAAIGIVAGSQYPDWGNHWARILAQGKGVGDHQIWMEATDFYESMPTIDVSGLPEDKKQVNLAIYTFLKKYADAIEELKKTDDVVEQEDAE